MLLNALIAAACCAVTAFVVLPSLAGDGMYSNVAAALRHTGHSLSGYTLRICLPHCSQPHCSMFTHGVAMFCVARNNARLGYQPAIACTAALLTLQCIALRISLSQHARACFSKPGECFVATRLLVHAVSQIYLLLQSLRSTRSPLMAKAKPARYSLYYDTPDWCCRYSSLMCSTRTADSGATAPKLQVGTAEPETATPKSAGTHPAMKAEGSYSTVQQRLGVQ